MYKMVVFDIDGTLVPHLNHIFSHEVEEMLARLKNNGYIVAFATGRDFISIASLHHNKNIDYFIGANGSFIYDLRNKEYIFNSSIDFNELKKYYDDVLMTNKSKINNIILSDDEWAYVFENSDKQGKNWFWNYFRNRFKNIAEAEKNINRDNFHLITVEFKPDTDILNLSKKYFDDINSTINVQAHWQKGMFIANRDITKAHSIKYLCDYLDIDIENVIAFGDGENDKEMLKEVGLGIAMGNATNEIKAIADEVTIDVEDFGTKYFLEKMGII